MHLLFEHAAFAAGPVPRQSRERFAVYEALRGTQQPDRLLGLVLVRGGPGQRDVPPELVDVHALGRDRQAVAEVDVLEPQLRIVALLQALTQSGHIRVQTHHLFRRCVFIPQAGNQRKIRNYVPWLPRERCHQLFHLGRPQPDLLPAGPEFDRTEQTEFHDDPPSRKLPLPNLEIVSLYARARTMMHVRPQICVGMCAAPRLSCLAGGDVAGQGICKREQAVRRTDRKIPHRAHSAFGCADWLKDG